MASQLFPKLIKSLRRLHFEGLVVEAASCLREPAEKVGLALPPPAVDDRDSEPRLGIGDKSVEVQPF